MLPANLLDAIHQTRYLYVNKDLSEIYVWNGDNVIRIYNYVGKEIGQSTIVNYNENKVYKKYENINIRDVTLSIDDIVFTSRQ